MTHPRAATLAAIAALSAIPAAAAHAHSRSTIPAAAHAHSRAKIARPPIPGARIPGARLRALSARASATAGTAAFGAPTVLARRDVYAVSVAVNQEGRALLAWNSGAGPGSGEAVAERVSGDGRRGHPQALGSGLTSDATASLAADGTGAVVWQRGRSLLGAVARPGQRFGATQTLTRRSVESQAVVAAAAGTVVAVWIQQPGGVRYSIAGSDGRFGPAHALPFSSFDLGDGDVQAAADAAGDVIVVVNEGPDKNPLPAGISYTVLRAGAATFSAPKMIPDGSSDPEPLLASGPGGVALAYADRVLRVATLGGNATFAAPRAAGAAVARLTPGTSTVTRPALALPGRGGPVAGADTYTVTIPGAASTLTGVMSAADPLPDGSFAPAATLAPATTHARDPLAAATTDLAVFAWEQGPDAHPLLTYSLQPAGGSFTAPRTLPSKGRYLNAALAAGGGRAILAWLDGGRLVMAHLAG